MGLELVIPQEKLTGYLLNPQHPVGRSKAAFFLALGFTQEDPEALGEALRAQARSAQVVERVPAWGGEKLICTGPLQTPSGQAPWIVSVWYIEKGSRAARLVTAYPHRRRDVQGG